ncbi:UDP-N-acetylglucosamine transporter-like [Panonychus citri]|uniref:UDP-N-acetylglucosamine transporter-like n=1 Tax=Panonychus citri TaxID=50023 RepID=UPI002307495A|nr:UDP-N-acetylglucosamine transporter-like [Panonychus citri]
MEKSKSDKHLLIHVGTKIESNDVKILHYEGKDSWFGNRDVLKYGSLITLTIQNCTLNLLMRASRTQKELFITSTAVILAELVKLITCIGMVYSNEGSSKGAIKTINNQIIKRPLDTLKVAVPSIIYYVQNNLLYLGATHLDAATCQIIYQLKILTTALFSVAMLGKRLYPHQWIALVLLFIGVALVQLQQTVSISSSSHHHQQQQQQTPEEIVKSTHINQSPFIGFMAILTACCLSGFAGVYFEKILKGEISLWIRNVQLSALTIPFGLIGILFTDFGPISEKGFFYGYSPLVWTVIFCQALGGLLCAVVVKYSDNIMKGFATSLAIVLSCVVSMFFLDFHPSSQFILGALIVMASVFLYGRQVPSSNSFAKTSS